MNGRVRRSWEMVALMFITLLAAGLRFYRLSEVPPGLHFDEGFKAITARALLEGAPPQLFFESDMGEEPIALYLVAAALGLAGEDPWMVRLPSAIVGTLTVPLAWWLGRELFRQRSPSRGPRHEAGKTQRHHDRREFAAPASSGRLQGAAAGLGTALVLAILYWHLSFSRIGMEPILVPFFATLAFAALVRGLNTGRWPAFFLAGAAVGGSLYTYKAGYFVPVLAVLFVVYAAIVERGTLWRHRRGLLLAALVAVLVAAPIGVYFVTHPANFMQRPASVALGADDGATLVENVPRVLGMFFLQGDANPRSNLPGRPALDPFLAILFLIGLGRALFSFRRPAFILPVLWLGVMVVPTLITEHAPHFGRAVGATPALALLCALGGWTAWRGAVRLERSWVQWATALLLTAGLIASGASTARAYFHIWGQSPDLFYAYDVGLTEVAHYVNTLPADEDVYLTPTPRDHYTLAFLVRRPLASFDGRTGLVFPPPGRAATVVVLLREDGETLPTLQQLRPDGELTWTLNDGYGRPYAAAYRLPPSDAPAPLPEHPIGAILGNAARLVGYSLSSGPTTAGAAAALAAGDTLTLTLYWQALAPLDADYTVFSHLLGGHNPATDGPLWAGHDGQPDGGHYPTTVWQPGQVILDLHPLTIPADAPPGDYQLEAGLYLLATLTRLPASDAAGNPWPDDAVLLGTVWIGD